ncbi:hypothetical protein NC651_032946 [Populus alba x Populus x berolinensis]|nr:hypothetical protein NC651_032946 [Populus alba x Populus x berolinensis]
MLKLDLLIDLKSSIDIILPNGVPLSQPVVYETLSRFCKLCKVLVHKTGVCSAVTASKETRHTSSKDNPSEASNNHYNVFYRLGPIAEPHLGSVEAHVVGPLHSFSPMSTEAAIATREWEIIKSKKVRKVSGISSGVMPTRDQSSTIHSKGKEPVGLPSEAKPTTDQGSLTLFKGKELIMTPSGRKGLEIVIVSATTVRGQRRSTYRATRSGPPTPHV